MIPCLSAISGGTKTEADMRNVPGHTRFRMLDGFDPYDPHLTQNLNVMMGTAPCFARRYLKHEATRNLGKVVKWVRTKMVPPYVDALPGSRLALTGTFLLEAGRSALSAMPTREQPAFDSYLMNVIISCLAYSQRLISQSLLILAPQSIHDVFRCGERVANDAFFYNKHVVGAMTQARAGYEFSMFGASVWFGTIADDLHNKVDLVVLFDGYPDIVLQVKTVSDPTHAGWMILKSTPCRVDTETEEEFVLRRDFYDGAKRLSAKMNRPFIPVLMNVSNADVPQTSLAHPGLREKIATLYAALREIANAANVHPSSLLSPADHLRPTGT